MKLTDKQKLWLRGAADIIVECLPEAIDIRGNALASGDDAEDRRAEDAIIQNLENGNEWAWCCVKVSLKWEDWEGTDYLGACSYKSKEEFIDADDYFPDMVARAFDELVQVIESSGESLNKLRAVS